MSALLHRREFAATALTLLGGAAVTVGCGGGSSSPSSPTTSSTNPHSDGSGPHSHMATFN